jgi:hypothetical protein
MWAAMKVQVKANPKLGMKNPLSTNLGEKTSLNPFFYHVHCFDPDFSYKANTHLT